MKCSVALPIVLSLVPLTAFGQSTPVCGHFTVVDELVESRFGCPIGEMKIGAYPTVYDCFTGEYVYTGAFPYWGLCAPHPAPPPEFLEVTDNCFDRAEYPECDTGPLCGDGVVEGNEQCDDGNQAGGDGCDSFCQLPLDGGELEEAIAEGAIVRITPHIEIDGSAGQHVGGMVPAHEVQITDSVATLTVAIQPILDGYGPNDQAEAAQDVADFMLPTVFVDPEGRDFAISVTEAIGGVPVVFHHHDHYDEDGNRVLSEVAAIDINGGTADILPSNLVYKAQIDVYEGGELTTAHALAQLFGLSPEYRGEHGVDCEPENVMCDYLGTFRTEHVDRFVDSVIYAANEDPDAFTVVPQ